MGWAHRGSKDATDFRCRNQRGLKGTRLRSTIMRNVQARTANGLLAMPRRRSKQGTVKTVIVRAMVAIAGMAMPSLASAGYVPIYGSPPYTPAAGGFVGVLELGPAGLNNAGTTVSFVDKYGPS